jgi:hypothetical protein
MTAYAYCHCSSLCECVRLYAVLLNRQGYLLILTCLAYDNFPFRWAVIAASRPAHFHLAATPRAEGELESRAHK